MGTKPGPKPQGLRGRSLRLPARQFEVYERAAALAGVSWNTYVASVLAHAHGLAPVGEQLAAPDPQLVLPLDQREGAA